MRLDQEKEQLYLYSDFLVKGCGSWLKISHLYLFIHPQDYLVNGSSV
jgi:hypothetical protein